MQWIRQLDNSLSCLFGEESYSVILVTFNSQECSWNTYTGSVASRSVTSKTYDRRGSRIQEEEERKQKKKRICGGSFPSADCMI